MYVRRAVLSVQTTFVHNNHYFKQNLQSTITLQVNRLSEWHNGDTIVIVSQSVACRQRDRLPDRYLGKYHNGLNGEGGNELNIGTKQCKGLHGVVKHKLFKCI